MSADNSVRIVEELERRLSLLIEAEADFGPPLSQVASKRRILQWSLSWSICVRGWTILPYLTPASTLNAIVGIANPTFMACPEYAQYFGRRTMKLIAGGDGSLVSTENIGGVLIAIVIEPETTRQH